MTGTVPIYDWIGDEGESIGLGTLVEYEHHASLGHIEGYHLGAIIGYEPAIEDEKRRAIWERRQ